MKMKKGITGKVLYVAEAVILLVVFLFGFRQERTLYTLSGQEIPALTESGEYEGESFSLTPGVYPDYPEGRAWSRGKPVCGNMQ